MKNEKRGRKKKDGLRIILRIIQKEVDLLNLRQAQTGLSRTELIRRAVDIYWKEKRHRNDWSLPPGQAIS